MPPRAAHRDRCREVIAPDAIRGRMGCPTIRREYSRLVTEGLIAVCTPALGVLRQACGGACALSGFTKRKAGSTIGNAAMSTLAQALVYIPSWILLWLLARLFMTNLLSLGGQVIRSPLPEGWGVGTGCFILGIGFIFLRPTVWTQYRANITNRRKLLTFGVWVLVTPLLVYGATVDGLTSLELTVFFAGVCFMLLACIFTVFFAPSSGFLELLDR
jgi:hypothetical protein